MRIVILILLITTPLFALPQKDPFAKPGDSQQSQRYAQVTAPDTIQIEVKVVELSESSLQEMGVSWETSNDANKLSDAQKTLDLIKKISIFVGEGKAKLLAKPKITTLTDQKAVIHIGDQVPYAVPVESSSGRNTWDVKYLDAGVNLTILPKKAPAGKILLEIQPQVSSLKQWKQTPGGEFPIISSRQVDTTLCLKSGETFLLGGLLNEEERENITKVPILGDIPIINFFFRYTTMEKVKSDVVFLVTATKI